MLKVHSFIFNPYQENTYLVYDRQGDCIIIDPGMSNYREEEELKAFIDNNSLNPVALYNTHCHVDHVLGNNYIYQQYGLKSLFHEGEMSTLVAVTTYAPQMGFNYTQAPIGEIFLKENDKISIGGYNLDIIFAPGHSPAHLCFYSEENKFLIAGDVLFRNSIGRTDLPGGNHQLLLNNIQKYIYTLPDDTIVYPGHGPSTTIGHEKNNNPFVRG